MAKVKKTKKTAGAKKPTRARKGRKPATPIPDLVIRLFEPGMTPMLRCGLGGLAASLRAILQDSAPGARWPSPVPLGPGLARVQPHQIVLEWGGDPEKVLKSLFAGSFRITWPHGFVDLPGTYDPERPPGDAVCAARQSALAVTFLQPALKGAKKRVAKGVLSHDIDGQELPFEFQGYKSYAQQDAWRDVLRILGGGSIRLAGWAYPGAKERHVGMNKVTHCDYGAAAALAALFAIVGCVVLDVPRASGGAVVIVEPNDLIRFARTRPKLPPRTLPECYVSGTGDAVLAVQLAFRMAAIQRYGSGVAATQAVMLGKAPWNKQQRVRVAAIEGGSFSEEALDLYDAVARQLPATFHLPKAVKKPGVRARSGKPMAFALTSRLRGFATENMARKLPWHRGFATARTDEKKPRFIHYYADKNNLGALRPSEKKGLITMLDHLEDTERSLVTSVHLALRHRFGAIASECKDNPVTMRNRFGSERDRWRHAFAGAKTGAQVRAALADLWSRAGSNRELQQHWQDILPLLREEHWRTARDLALVALASYQGAGAETADDTSSE